MPLDWITIQHCNVLLLLLLGNTKSNNRQTKTIKEQCHTKQIYNGMKQKVFGWIPQESFDAKDPPEIHTQVASEVVFVFHRGRDRPPAHAPGNSVEIPTTG